MLRSLCLVGVFGLGVAASTALSSLGTNGGHGVLARSLGLVSSGLVNIGVFLAAFRVLTPSEIGFADVAPGAVAAGLGWELLQAIGGYLVGHQLRHASPIYGTFAIVLGLLGFLYLGSEISVYAAEWSVVRSRRLWPRSIVPPPLTVADKTVLAAIALQEERRPEQQVLVQFRDP